MKEDKTKKTEKGGEKGERREEIFQKCPSQIHNYDRWCKMTKLAVTFSFLCGWVIFYFFILGAEFHPSI